MKYGNRRALLLRLGPGTRQIWMSWMRVCKQRSLSPCPAANSKENGFSYAPLRNLGKEDEDLPL